MQFNPENMHHISYITSASESTAIPRKEKQSRPLMGPFYIEFSTLATEYGYYYNSRSIVV